MKKLITAILLCGASSISYNAQAQTSDSLKTVTIKVANLHCNNDMPTIKRRLQNQDGVEEISFTEIDGDKSTFTISYHSSTTNQDKIEKAIESTPGCDDADSRPYKVKKTNQNKKRSK